MKLTEFMSEMRIEYLEDFENWMDERIADAMDKGKDLDNRSRSEWIDAFVRYMKKRKV